VRVTRVPFPPRGDGGACDTSPPGWGVGGHARGTRTPGTRTPGTRTRDTHGALPWLLPLPGDAVSHTAAHAESVKATQFMARLLRQTRNRSLSRELRAQLGFARGERVLMVSRDPESECLLIATDRALHCRAELGSPADAGRETWSRLGWAQVTSVSWEDGYLVIASLTAHAPTRTSVPLRQPGQWPELAQDRITHTRLTRQRVLLDGGQRVLVEVRRCPATGELRWVLTASSALDRGDQNLRRQVDRAVTAMCTELGIPVPSADLAVPQPRQAGDDAGLLRAPFRVFPRVPSGRGLSRLTRLRVPSGADLPLPRTAPRTP
jgi:hypothetical protein